MSLSMRSLGIAIMATLITSATAAKGSTVSACEYTGSGLHRVQLNLTRLPASSVPMYKAMCAKKTDGLAGMGDVACWYNDKHAELHVIKGNRVPLR